MGHFNCPLNRHSSLGPIRCPLPLSPGCPIICWVALNSKLARTTRISAWPPHRAPLLDPRLMNDSHCLLMNCAHLTIYHNGLNRQREQLIHLSTLASLSALHFRGAVTLEARPKKSSRPCELRLISHSYCRQHQAPLRALRDTVGNTAKH